MRYFLRCLFAACLTLGMSVSAHAELDENGIEPYSWIRFDDLTVGTVASGKTTANYGSSSTAMSLPAGSAVKVKGTDIAWQFGSASSNPGSGIAPGNSLRPTTYITRLNLNGGTFSDNNIWGANGKLYGGLSLSVSGSGSSYQIFLGKHDNGGVKEKIYTYSVPADKIEGFHWYAITTASSGTECHFYVDGSEVYSTTSASFTQSQNSQFGWGQLGNAGAGNAANGLQVSDFRIYTQVLTEEQIKVIATPLLIWGTAGWAGKGVSTKSDGSFESVSWTFNLSKDDNIVHDDIDLTKRVAFKKIRMMQRANKGNKPTAATLKQGSVELAATSVTSHDDDATGMTLYDSTGAASVKRGYHEFVFDGSTEFDPNSDIQLVFDHPKAGCSVTQPANSVMGNGTWSPVIEFTAVHPSDAADYVATIDKDTTFTGITSWTPSRPTTFKSSDILEIDNTASVTLTMDEAITVKKLKIVNDEGSALKLNMQTMPTIGTYDFSKAVGGVIFDASGVDGRELAKKTAYGAPYSYWLLKGTVKGGEHITVTPPTMPSGYDVTTVIDDWGVRIVVMAPKEAKFGSVNINFAGGRNGVVFADDSKVGTLTTEVGGHPVVGTSWNDLSAENQTDTTVPKYVKTDGTTVTSADIKLTASQVNNPYTSGAAAHMLITGYIDDSQSPIVQISKIPFSKYRVILYRATDTGNTTFSAAQIGTTASNTKIYYGPAKSNTDVKYTVQGSAENDWGKSDKRDGYYEGVNYIVSDVLEGTAGSATAYINSHKHAGRAGVAAIQIVEVGHIVEGLTEFKATISAAGTHNLTDLDWTPKPFAPTKDTDVKITIDPSVKGEVTINLDKSNMSVKDIVLNSSGDATMTLKGYNPVAISGWNFLATKGRVTFASSAFDINKVTRGAYPRLGLAYPYTGTIESGYEYLGTGNVLTMTSFDNGCDVVIAGTGTLTGDLDIYANGSVTMGGTYTSPNNDVRLATTMGTLTIAEGADISVTSICLVNSGNTGNNGILNINGKLTVTSECGSTVYGPHTRHEGILFGHYYGSSPVTVGATGQLIGENTWIQLTYTATSSLTIDGGLVKVRGINIGNKELNSSIKVQNGGVLALKEGLVNQNYATYTFDGGILKAWGASYDWTPGKTTIGKSKKSMIFDPNGLTITTTGDFTEETAGGKLVVTNSASGGALLINHATTHTGGTVVQSDATLKLGADLILGTGDVMVEKGGTLDYFGHGLTNNWVAVAGTGVKGGGALVNTGNAVDFKAKIRLSGDATIGGSKAIGFSQGSGVDAAGHALTLDGDGMTLKLGGMTVSNCVALAVTRGTLASNGATSLGNADLSIGEYGILNLAGGNSLSCSNFVSKGTVEGVGARLIVSGEFDASSAVTIPRLKLKNDATLRGVGLKITDLLEMEERLYVWVPELKSSVTIAAVPESKDRVTLCKTVVVNGTSDYAIQHVGEKLVVKSGGVVNADVALTSVTGGLNFEELWIEGVVREFSGKAGAGSGKTNVNVIVTYADGSVVTQKYDYVSNEFRYVLPDFDVGRYYGVQAFLTIEGAEVDAYSAKESAVTARTLDAWIDENWETFDGRRMGTGAWADPYGIAEAVSKDAVIAYAASNRDEYVCFTSTNRAQIAELGGLKDIHISETFKGAAYCLGKEEPPALEQTNGVIAVAVATNVLGECQFAVVTSNGWQVIGRETFEPSLNVPCEIVVRIDEGAGTISYGVVRDEAIVWILADGPYQPWSSGLVRIVFFGAGRIAKIAGTCHDTNLAQVTIDKTTREYATFEEALEAAGADNVITPLWWSNAEITGQRGAFCVKSNGYFEPIFAKWYHYEKTPGEAEDRYRYIAANNWIEYSDEGGVEREANGAYRVTSEQGLAWIAEQATNGVFEGAVTLGENLDLSSKNWTPIANFTGSFDGKGFTIEGLNNTNVIIDPLLGEAGYYFGGVTNASGYTAYGLFGCTKDAAFRNITLRDVAISNTADSVSALVGVHALGDLTVEGVTNASGVVWGEGAVVAGLVTIGGNGGDIGNVVVKDNVNRAEIVGAENAAQILAGTSADTKFTGTVDATGNGGEEVPVSLYLNMPICNFAAAIERYDEQTNYWRYVEANEKDSVPIDPVNRTARMLAGYFDNGTVNHMGQLTDLITASENGAKIVVPNATTNDCWSTVLVDRNITLDLGGTCIYGVYDCDLFTVTNGAKLIIGNGELVKVEGYEYYRVATGSSVEETQPLAKGENSGTFYDRTVGVKTFGVVADQATIVISYTSPDFLYTVQHVSTLAEEWQNVEGYTDVFGTGGEMTFELDASEDSGFYRVKMVPWWYQPEE